jgi:hypothetical protein
VSFNPDTRKLHRTATALAAVALLVALPDRAHAQAAPTPAQFIESCRNNPGNTVVLTQGTKFQTGFAGTTFSTPTGCTVVLAPGASFELDTLTMRFGGPVVVQGNDKGKIVIDKATLTAPSITLNLTGFEGQFQFNEGQLTASTGALRIQFGDKGFMEVNNSGRWYQPRLRAQRDVLSISAGAFFNATIVQSGLQGARGIGFARNGSDSGVKIEGSDLLVSSGATSAGPYMAGPLTVAGSAAKVSFDTIQVKLMEARAGLGGSCSVSPQGLNTPVLEPCR